MYSEENAIRSLLSREFQSKIADKILVKVYENKIYPKLDVTGKALFDAYYTIQDDFYILSNTIPNVDKNKIQSIIFNSRYSAWFTELPPESASTNDINISVLQDTYKDNLKNPLIEQKLTEFIYCSTESYIEMLFISRILKKIMITKSMSEDDRTVKGYKFHRIISSGPMSMIPDNYLVNLFGKYFYLRQLNFELVYEEI
jgi:hypothetical protein